mmetsp:Transcript_99440/g.280609  ORF Transcript_99440/g.280609 Transcript_99440/m.280609 type:complete len:211 (+) Transcript_99440:1052-1684(+)
MAWRRARCRLAATGWVRRWATHSSSCPRLSLRRRRSRKSRATNLGTVVSNSSGRATKSCGCFQACLPRKKPVRGLGGVTSFRPPKPRQALVTRRGTNSCGASRSCNEATKTAGKSGGSSATSYKLVSMTPRDRPLRPCGPSSRHTMRAMSLAQPASFGAGCCDFEASLSIVASLMWHNSLKTSRSTTHRSSSVEIAVARTQATCTLDSPL